ncbi:hypothetical protein FRC04_010627 [Tulasnella sp. 424]|nr:hypothetical protein FRC04_010627 [Tulasnella sp. 424]KAG8972449.1 hypothetical protein FRC05_010042 [Tulasnella sp. 425]
MDTYDIREIQKRVEEAPNEDPFPGKIAPLAVFGSLSPYRVDPSDIKSTSVDKVSKKGGNADVELATFCPSPESEDPQHIAVRKVRFGDKADDRRVLGSFAYELGILVKLSHKNVVKLIGFVHNMEERIAWMVFRWEANGNLREFIHSANWEIPERISLIDDVASGLEYLHSSNPPICHGDLKSLNVLVNSENRAIITDFGSARILQASDGTSERTHANLVNEKPHNPPESKESSNFRAEVDESGAFITISGPDWSLRWAAPELLAEALPSLASDIWAFGWVCWEVMTGTFPFEEVSLGSAVIVRVIQGRLPSIDTHVYMAQVRALCTLMTECWSASPSSRPAAERCRTDLRWMTSVVPSLGGRGDNAQAYSVELLQATGRMHFSHGRSSEAKHDFNKSLKISSRTKNDLGIANAVFGLAEIAGVESNFSQAEPLYTNAHAIYTRIGNQFGVAKTAAQLGAILRTQGHYPRGESLLQEARDLYYQLENLPGLGNACLELGHFYRLQGKYSNAESCLREAHGIFSVVGQMRGVANTNTELGNVYGLQGDHSRAEALFKEARKIYDQIGDQLGIANAMRGLGDVFCAQNKYEESEEFFTRAREIFSLVGNQLGVAHSVLGLGKVYLNQERFTDAESCYTEARVMYSRTGSQLGIAESSDGLGTIYYKEGLCHKAEFLLVESRDAYARLGNRSGLASSICGLGYTYRRQDDYAKAHASFVEARELFAEEEDGQGVAHCVYGLGDIYRQLGRYSEAVDLLSEARDLYVQTGNQSAVARTVGALGNVYRGQGDYDKAELSYIEAMEICSSLGRRHVKADVLWDLGLLRGRQIRLLEAEQFIKEACTIYRELGLDYDLSQCVWLLEEIRKMIRIVRRKDTLLGWLPRFARRVRSLVSSHSS